MLPPFLGASQRIVVPLAAAVAYYDQAGHTSTIPSEGGTLAGEHGVTVTARDRHAWVVRDAR